MIAYLIETRKRFQDVDQRLTATIGTVALQRWGVTPEVIDAWYHDMLGRVERGELNSPNLVSTTNVPGAGGAQSPHARHRPRRGQLTLPG